MYVSSFLYHKTYCEHIYIDLSGLLNVQLSPSGVCAINGLLYVIGGDDGSCNLSSVEFYNPATDKWSLIPTNMSNGRSYAGKSDNSTDNIPASYREVQFTCACSRFPHSVLRFLTPTGVAVIDKPLWPGASSSVGSASAAHLTETHADAWSPTGKMRSIAIWTERPQSSVVLVTKRATRGGFLSETFQLVRPWRWGTLLHWKRNNIHMTVGLQELCLGEMVSFKCQADNLWLYQLTYDSLRRWCWKDFGKNPTQSDWMEPSGDGLCQTWEPFFSFFLILRLATIPQTTFARRVFKKWGRLFGSCADRQLVQRAEAWCGRVVAECICSQPGPRERCEII